MVNHSEQEKAFLIQRSNTSNKFYGSKRSEENNEPNKVGTYSAVSVLMAAFIVMAVKDGTIHASNVFVDILVNETNARKDTVLAIETIELFISGAGAPLAASLINMHGPKMVCIIGALMSGMGMLIITLVPTVVYGFFLAQSLVSGLGFSFASMAALVSLKEHFTEKRFLALAFAMCGGAMGRPVIDFLSRYLLDWFGWQFSMYVLSGISLSCAFLGQVFIKPYRSREAMEMEVRSHSPNHIMMLLERKALTSRSLSQFLLVIVADVLFVIGLHIFCCYLQPVVLSAGVESDSADFLFNILGVGCVSGLLMSGFLSDCGWYHPVESAALAIFCSTTLPALISIQTEYSMFAIYTGFLGFLAGYWLAATNHILVSVIGLNQFASSLGILFAARSIGTLAAPLAVNILMSVVGEDPSNVFYLTSILFGVSCFLYTSAGCFIRRHSDIIREEDGVMEWDNAGEDWDQEDFETCEWDEEEHCQPCDSPCPEENGRRRVRSEVGESCLLSCEQESGEEETCQPCDEEEEERKNGRKDCIPCEQIENEQEFIEKYK